MTDTADPTPTSTDRERRTATASTPPAPSSSSEPETATAEETPKRTPGTYDVKDGPTARARRAERQAEPEAE